ncbi:hypothetical protein C6568_01770 [Melaminivora suipulveris]|uniref:Uncharacterized protein n=1 Tax=Melaminivora suipulveris TaxID=2109913 RepID=A0A2R3Q8X1_9BURK|nr:hypothetical protein [Melaminivora suipulveris]AVO48124.1 hypothetical protein C6568_01770 [Melaminivora suipulveris]
MPYVIQSATTGAFLSPSYEDGQPEWVILLREAVPVDDLETCAQLIEDHVEGWHRAQVVDLQQLHRIDF